MKKLFMVVPLVLLLCLTFSCQQGEKQAEPSLEQTKIAFMSYRDGRSEIYVMNIDGSEQTNLTNNPADDMDPIWSPDGKKIAFVSDRDGIEDRTDTIRGLKIYHNLNIYVMNPDGSELIKLTNNDTFDLNLTWSPDGKKIAFYTERDRYPEINAEIYVMNADGSEQTNLTKKPDTDVSPSWSPYLKTVK